MSRRGCVESMCATGDLRLVTITTDAIYSNKSRGLQDCGVRPTRIGRCAMMHVVIFSGQEIQNPDIEHRLANRIGRCARIIVICLGQVIQNQISHIDMRIESVDVRKCM